MRHRFGSWSWFCLAAVAVCAAMAARVTAASALEAQIAEFFVPPDITQPRLSPTGEHVAVVARQGDSAVVGMFDLASGQQTIVYKAKKGPVLNVWWKTARRLLVLTQNLEEHRREFVGVNLDGSEVEDLWKLNQYRWLQDILPNDPDNLLMLSGNSVVRVEMKTGNFKTVEDSLTNVGVWITDRTGEVRAARGGAGDKHTFFWRAPGETRWRNRISATPFPEFIPIAFEQDGRYLVGWDFQQGDNITISQFDTVTEKREVLVQRPGIDPTTVDIVEWPRRVLAARFAQAPDAPMFAIDPTFAQGMAKLRQSFPQFLVDFYGTAKADKLWLVGLSSSRVPQAYALFEPATGKATMLANAMGNRLPEAKLAPAEPFSFTSRAGQKITGMIWRPAKTPRAPLVMVLPAEVPGEPAYNGYEADTQAYVANGFAVVRVNARGTGGFGRKYLEAAEADPSGVLREDFEDVAEAFVKRGVIDPERVAVMGRDMGGALAVHLATTSKAIKAVVNVNGPVEMSRYDLSSFSWNRDGSGVGQRFGNWTNARHLAESLSVLATAPKCTVPALHLYNDSPENKGLLNDSGRRVRKAIEAAKAPGRADIALSWTNYQRLPAHWAQEQTAMTARVIEFLRATFPASAAAAAAEAPGAAKAK